MAAIAKESRDSLSESRAFRAFAPRKCGFPRFSSQEWDIMKRLCEQPTLQVLMEGRNSMVSRIYVEKRPGFDVEARQLAGELRTILGIDGLSRVRLINRYDVEGISSELFDQCVPTVFSEPQADVATAELPVEGATIADDGSVSAPAGVAVFAVEFLPGQFDQRADSASECVQLISQGERPDVRSAKVYVLEGELSAADVDAIKHYVINPIEAREASLAPRETLHMQVVNPDPVEVIDGFIDLDEAGGVPF